MKEWIVTPEMKEHTSFREAKAVMEEAEKARNKALYYLQFSAKTECELRKKLAEQEFSPASVDDAVAFLKSYHYLNDYDYTVRYVEKNARKKSRRQLRYELLGKGVKSDIIDDVFETEPVEEEFQILHYLEKKHYRGEESTPEERQKISAALARKGFSYEKITKALIHFARKNEFNSNPT